VTIFQPIKTTRLDVRMRELSVREARAVCEINPKSHEATITQFLRAATGLDTGSAGMDPLRMSVQERTLLVCHYLSSVLDDGPDFRVGADMRLSQFLDLEADAYLDEVEAGEIQGEVVYMGQLLGQHAVDLEMVCNDRGDWRIGLMACQIRLASMPAVDVCAMSEAERMAWLDSRIEAIASMPESQASELFDTIFIPGQQKLRHFFDVALDNDGICFHSDEEAGLGLGRFHPVSGISKRTTEIFF
jgi:hypothetical protein